MLDLPFPDLQDSPLFYARCSELGGVAASLGSRFQVLSSGAGKYTQSLEEAYQASLRFADCLSTFCGSDDEEGLRMGGPIIARFVQTIREMSSFLELLRTQVELILCDRLFQYSMGIANEVTSSKKVMEQRAAEYESLRSRNLFRTRSGRNTQRSSGVGASAKSSVMEALVLAQDARFTFARNLLRADSHSRFVFLESIASAMQAHLQYFQHGYDLMNSLYPYMQETLELVNRLKIDGNEKGKALESMINAHRASYQGSESNSAVTEVTEKHGEEIEAQPRSGRPLQMSAAAVALTSELNAYIQATKTSGGSQITVLRQGWLLKQSSRIKTKWQRRFFVLDSTGTLYYYSNKVQQGGNTSSTGSIEQMRHHTVNLLTATVKPNVSLSSTFHLISPDREYTVAAEEASEAREWVETLQSVIACLLSCSLDEVLPAKRPFSPQRPTHTRAISIDLRGTKKEGTQVWQAQSPAGALLSLQDNDSCADCGSTSPDWGSLNLGAILCIECSGIHRKLGSHVSKVRSFNLDVKAWDDNVLMLMSKLGNGFVNSVWEERLIYAAGQSTGDNAWQKPNTATPTALKEKYIIAKYVEKAFISNSATHGPDTDSLSALLWSAVQCSNIQDAYRALVHGADPAAAAPTNEDYAEELVLRTNTLWCDKKDTVVKPSSIDASNVLVIHVAAATGDVAMVELLLQWNAALVDQVDAYGRGPLEYALIHDNSQVAKQILRRMSSDKRGAVVSLTMAGPRCREDQELLTLLSHDNHVSSNGAI